MEMQKRIDLQDAALQQLKNVFTEALSASRANEGVNASWAFDSLLQTRFISITPPLEKPLTMQLLTLDSLRDYKNGSSIKPGNIVLNIKELIEAIPEVVSIGAGMVCDNLVITVCGAFSLWLKLRDIATVSITREQAFTIVALWKSCNSAHKISLDDGFIATNVLLKQYGESEITNLKYNIVIDSLIKMQCIELTEGIIWLREWISRSYIYSIQAKKRELTD